MSPDGSLQRAVSADRQARLGGSFSRHFVMLFSNPHGFLLSGFIFSMFSASFLEKALFRPFVFNMFSASWFFATGGQDVAMQFGGVEAGKPAS